MSTKIVKKCRLKILKSVDWTLTIYKKNAIFNGEVKKMKFNETEYKNRLIEKKLEEYLSVFGAVSIEGPKWCGKTWTSLKHSKSEVYMDDDDVREMAKLDVKSIFNQDSAKKPQLIDEWNLVPTIWDAVRRECDKTTEKGNFIITGSTTLPNKVMKEKVHHSGAGRIGRLNMYTMSLYESGDSSGEASLTRMLDNTQETINTGSIEILQLAKLLVRGGWPANINVSENKIGLIPKSYIDSILNIDMNEGTEKRRDKNKMRMLLKSLARNEASIVGNKTIIKDIEEYENEAERLASRDTVIDYLDVLDRLHLIENQEAYGENYRSPGRVGKSPKRHLTDPSLSCACLGLTPEKLLKDLNTFGFMFEALVERDLRIYMDYLDGHLYHFRDNVTGLEVDSILEFEDGEYAAVEIKLGYNQVEEAKKSLVSFYGNMIKKPAFMCIIVGKCPAVIKDKETGIYIVPITALKP